MTPTRIAGEMAYGAAMVGCLVALCRARRDALLVSLAAVLAFLEALLLLDMVFDWRWALHRWLQAGFVSHHLYGRRHGVQILMLLLVAAGLAFAVRYGMQRFRGRLLAIAAASGLCFSVAAWCVEVISLHEIDRLLYAKAGGLLTIALFWIFFCSVTTVSILAEALKLPAPRQRFLRKKSVIRS